MIDSSLCDESSRSGHDERFRSVCGATDSRMPSPESIPFSLPPQQQISIIMSINGVINGAIPNVKWPTLVLTEANSGKVDGEEFTKIDNQRWVGEFDYDQRKQINLGAIRNRKSGNSLHKFAGQHERRHEQHSILVESDLPRGPRRIPSPRGKNGLRDVRDH